MKFCYNTSFTLPKNLKDLDPSCKTDLDLWDCFGRAKIRFITEPTINIVGLAGIPQILEHRKLVKFLKF